MRFYLASRYSRREELTGYRDKLKAFGHEVITRWLDTEWANRPDQSSAAPPECRATYAKIDLEDIRAADVVVSFTEPPAHQCGACHGKKHLNVSGGMMQECQHCDGKGFIDSGRGGRHVEFGYALALGKVCIVVGPRENLFYEHPNVYGYSGPDDFISDAVNGRLPYFRTKPHEPEIEIDLNGDDGRVTWAVQQTMPCTCGYVAQVNLSGYGGSAPVLNYEFLKCPRCNRTKPLANSPDNTAPENPAGGSP